MKEKTKNLTIHFIGIFVLGLLMLPTIVQATEVGFTNEYVESNQWSYVTVATKQTTSTYAELYVTQIRKADGSASNYSYVQAKASSIGIAHTILKGDYRQVSILGSYQTSGTNLELYMMGNNPALDCRVYGYWDVH